MILQHPINTLVALDMISNRDDGKADLNTTTSRRRNYVDILSTSSSQPQAEAASQRLVGGRRRCRSSTTEEDASTTTTPPPPSFKKPRLASSSESGSESSSSSITKHKKKAKAAAQSLLTLDPNFEPGNFDVICGRGRDSYYHPGNQFLRNLIQRYHDDFGKATTRVERMDVVTNVIEQVRSKGMGFIKQDETGGTWSVVSDRLAREKVGNMFRNSQGGKYRSSFQSKQKKRQEFIATVNRRTQQVVLSNPVVSNVLHTMSHVLSTTKHMSDDEFFEMCTKANSIMLTALKQDTTGILLQRFNDAMCIIDDDEFEDTSIL